MSKVKIVSGGNSMGTVITANGVELNCVTKIEISPITLQSGLITAKLTMVDVELDIEAEANDPSSYDSLESESDSHFAGSDMPADSYISYNVDGERRYTKAWMEQERAIPPDRRAPIDKPSVDNRVADINAAMKKAMDSVKRPSFAECLEKIKLDGKKSTESARAAWFKGLPKCNEYRYAVVDEISEFDGLTYCLEREVRHAKSRLEAKDKELFCRLSAELYEFNHRNDERYEIRGYDGLGANQLHARPAYRASAEDAASGLRLVGEAFKERGW